MDHAKQIDASNSNRFWKEAFDKEIANVAFAFEILYEVKPAPIAWTKDSGHLVFDVKMDFTRKARWVKYGHRTADPENSTFFGFVSQERYRIAFTYAKLNGLDVTADDIKNAYLQAPSSETNYVICIAKFGLENIGKISLIRRALYRGKSIGADVWKHCWSCMTHLGFTPCKADPGIWIREAHKYDVTPFWEYILLYDDHALVISNRV